SSPLLLRLPIHIFRPSQSFACLLFILFFILLLVFSFFFFFFNDTATTEIYTLSLHDALPISCKPLPSFCRSRRLCIPRFASISADRKSTRLNSSHVKISYAVFCLKKKKKKKKKKTYDKK